MRCWNAASGNYDCDHSPYRSLGITYGTSGFMATYGWGYPGSVEVTTNGTNWSTVHTGGTFAGVAYGNSTYLLNDWDMLYSTNGGTTWSRGASVPFNVNNPRALHFAGVGTGIFITQAESGGVQDLLISSNNGRTFVRPNRPSSCGVGPVANNSNTVMLLSRSLCRSTDAGQTWTEVTPKPSGNIMIYNGTEFRIYTDGQVHRSTNGTSWTSTSLRLNGAVNGNLSFAVLNYHPTLRKYVGIYQGWDRYYEYTRYYHSDDGISWTEITRNAANVPLTPHPLAQIAVGFLPQSACR